ncbi:MAG: T9SS type A sorting domain-containing protein [Ignavibacteriaceae bacterium]
MKIFDILGNEIETLVKEEKPAGTYEITWYANNLPSGVYFYQLKSGSFVETKKMVLMK